MIYTRERTVRRANLPFLLLVAVLLTSFGHINARVIPDQETYNQVFRAKSDSLETHLLERVQHKAEQIRNRADSIDVRPENVMTTTEHRIDLLEAALLIKSGADPGFGNALLQQQARSPFRGGMFYLHDMIAAYLHAHEGLTGKTKRLIRRSFKEQAIYRGDTENHWALYYTGLYLAAQTWPDDPDTTWFNGKSSSRIKKEAREYLIHWMDITTTIGQGEFDSPTYFIVFISPMLTLHTFCEDPVLKAKAGKMLDWLLADYAAEYLKGLYAGGHSRDYPYDAIKPEGAPAVGWGWLFFGETDPVYRSDNLLAAWGEYRMPVIIQNIAADRSSSYEHFERKRVRNVIRYGDRMNPPVYKNTFMTPTYALGSLQGGILQPIQQHTWDVTFHDPDTNSTIFTLHPYYSGYELAMFFPEEIEWLSDEVDRYHKVYTSHDKWNSSSPYERTFQHRDAIIVLYDIAPDAHHGHIDGFFPKTLDAREEDDSGWIFCRGGSTYVAVFPLRPYEWIEENAGWRLRSHHRRNGVIVEAANASEYPSFQAFQSDIRDNPVDTTAFQELRRIHYTTSAGDRMAFTYPDQRMLNGIPLDLSEIPLFQGPYMYGDGQRQRVVLTYGEKRHVIDFGEEGR